LTAGGAEDDDEFGHCDSRKKERRGFFPWMQGIPELDGSIQFGRNIAARYTPAGY
jgi:hypothetical protein